MSDLLVKLMILAALAQLGMSLGDIQSCRSKSCLRKIELQSRNVLRISWKPISVFPEVGRQFR